MTFNLIGASANPIPVSLVTAGSLDGWCDGTDDFGGNWVRRLGFGAEEGEICFVPGEAGSLSRVLLGVLETNRASLWTLAGLPKTLPQGQYSIDANLSTSDATLAASGWAIGTYRFDRYRHVEKMGAELVWPKGADRAHVCRTSSATALVRDLINMPACEMGPTELTDAAITLGEKYHAKTRVVVGLELLKEGYPAIHAVGRAADDPPRLIDIRWGEPEFPKVTLVGKGVCFDTGGYNLKTASGIVAMKDDMGGAAQALALASMVMDANLPVRLRILLPVVKNMVSGNSLLPGDIIRTRKGTTVEVTNTDAEGRLILCDVLAEADSEHPELVIDYATLTGAARVALGPELPALFSNNEDVAADLVKHGALEDDPLWRLPLYRSYRTMLNSDIADMSNFSEDRNAGAITAALFLQHFVSSSTRWAHIDACCVNRKARPGRPVGGEAMGIRAAYRLIQDYFGGFTS